MASPDSTIGQQLSATEFSMAGEASSGQRAAHAATNTVMMQINCELGADLQGSTTTRTVLIQPSKKDTIVVAEVNVLTDSAKTFTSPNYLGTKRRQGCTRLITGFQKLALVADQSDFISHTFAIFDDIAKLTAMLMVNENAEGNACAILRRIRNCFLDNGAMCFCQPEARAAAIKVLVSLSENREVEVFDVPNSIRTLRLAGLNPSLKLEFDAADDDDGDSSEEKKVSD